MHGAILFGISRAIRQQSDCPSHLRAASNRAVKVTEKVGSPRSQHCDTAYKCTDVRVPIFVEATARNTAVCASGSASRAAQS